MKHRSQKLKPYKISRGSFEEQQLREDNRLQNQRALLIILPVVMVAVFAVGVFFGYKSWRKSVGEERTVTSSGAVEETTAEINPMLLRSVSSASPLTADDVPALTEYRGVPVSPDLVGSLDRMLADARDDGYDFVLKEGYISFEEQKERYEKAVEEYRKSAKATLVKAESYVKRTVSREGECEQQTGLLVYLDVDGEEKFSKSAAYQWLLRNSVSYGFVLRYPEKENIGGLSFSSNLFRYVGEENAYYIRAYNMNFDEYLAYISAH